MPTQLEGPVTINGSLSVNGTLEGQISRTGLLVEQNLVIPVPLAAFRVVGLNGRVANGRQLR